MIPGVQSIAYSELAGSRIDYLDSGGILHIRDYWGTRFFLDLVSSVIARNGQSAGELDRILVSREVPSILALAEFTKSLKRFVHNHAFAMAVAPLIERLGCAVDVTHIDCGVIRYQLLDDLRTVAKESGYFEDADFARLDSRGIPEIFGYSKLPPHRDVRWPHIRILGFWMPLTDLEEGEALTLFPEAFGRAVATGDPAVEPFPTENDPNDFGLGVAVSPAMNAGDVMAFHAATVHCSPARQVGVFRGSIDFRVAYPCIDDFRHYKSTFVQARNLIHRGDAGNPISPGMQRRAMESMVDELAGSGKPARCSIQENRCALERTGERISLRVALAFVTVRQFCPDTLMWMVSRAESGLVRCLLLAQFVFRTRSYFWLYQALVAAETHGYRSLARLLKARTRKACETTSLPIVNIPIEWEGTARELVPEEVLRRLAGQS